MKEKVVVYPFKKFVKNVIFGIILLLISFGCVAPLTTQISRGGGR